MTGCIIKCSDPTGRCFGRRDDWCRVLNGPLRPCPFKKPHAEVTKGKRYPYYALSGPQAHRSVRLEARRDSA